MTNMHREIIKFGNEMGYFLTVKQADRAWAQLNLLIAQARVNDPKAFRGNVNDEDYNRVMKQAVEITMNGAK